MGLGVGELDGDDVGDAEGAGVGALDGCSDVLGDSLGL